MNDEHTKKKKKKKKYHPPTFVYHLRTPEPNKRGSPERSNTGVKQGIRDQLSITSGKDKRSEIIYIFFPIFFHHLCLIFGCCFRSKDVERERKKRELE